MVYKKKVLARIPKGGGGETYATGTWDDIQAGADNTAKVWSAATLNNLIDESTVADGSVTEAKLADGAVTSRKIASKAVTAGKIARIDKVDLELNGEESYISYYSNSTSTSPQAMLGMMDGFFTVATASDIGFQVMRFISDTAGYVTDFKANADGVEIGQTGENRQIKLNGKQLVDGTNTLYASGVKVIGKSDDYIVLAGGGTTRLAVITDALTALQERLTALEAKVTHYHPDPQPLPAYSVSTEKPTQATIGSLVDPTATKPTTAIQVDMTSLTKPTMCYLVYPQEWEVVVDDVIQIPYMVDSNGFEVGATFDADTPLLTTGGVVYRVLDIRLGKGIYNLNFKR